MELVPKYNKETKLFVEKVMIFLNLHSHGFVVVMKRQNYPSLDSSNFFVLYISQLTYFFTGQLKRSA